VRLTPDNPDAVIQVLLPIPQTIKRGPGGGYRLFLTAGDAPASIIATWPKPPAPPVADQLTLEQQGTLVAKDDVGVRLYFAIEYPLQPTSRKPQEIVNNLLDPSPAFWAMWV